MQTQMLIEGSMISMVVQVSQVWFSTGNGCYMTHHAVAAIKISKGGATGK